MSNENMTWQEVCRELLRLDEEGVEEPWREFEAWLGNPFNGWRESRSLSDLFYIADAGLPLRLKPRTIRVTTHSGEVLDLPEPCWNAPHRATLWAVLGSGDVDWFVNNGLVIGHKNMRIGNAFRTEEDAQAWADAMPKIRGLK